MYIELNKCRFGTIEKTGAANTLVGSMTDWMHSPRWWSLGYDITASTIDSKSETIDSNCETIDSKSETIDCNGETIDSKSETIDSKNYQLTNTY